MKKFLILLPLVCLFGCYAGSVKPLLNRPEFRAENEPVRTLRVLLITDPSYRKDEIKKFISKCSTLMEVQVGVRLEILHWYQIKWKDERSDISKMEMRIAADTWSQRDQFDIALTFVYFVQGVEGGKLPLGATDTFFWRYLFVKELDPYILLHELFHAFLQEKGHSANWVMRSARPSYGNEWYWLTPEDRKRVLRNKWRDFNLMPAGGKREENESKESWFYNNLGLIFFQQGALDQAISLFNKSLEINPKYAAAYVSKGRAYHLKAEYDKSWEDIHKAEALGSTIPAEFLDQLRRDSGRER